MVYPIGDGNFLDKTYKIFHNNINLMVYPIGDGNNSTISLYRPFNY